VEGSAGPGGWVGGTDRLEPIEAALSALASCINVGISINAVANGVDIKHLQTRVRTGFDPRVLFSLEDLEAATAVFENLTAEVEIESPDLDKDQIDEWARRAPVYTLVSLAQDVQLTVKTPAEVTADDICLSYSISIASNRQSRAFTGTSPRPWPRNTTSRWVAG
jgi:uncharacterized OsmC-like protein